jgi:hypothetical protein
MIQCRPHGLRRAMTLFAALAFTCVAFGFILPARAEIGGSFPEFGAETGGLNASFERPATARLANNNFVLAIGVRANKRVNSGPYFQIYSRARPRCAQSSSAHPAFISKKSNGVAYLL